MQHLTPEQITELAEYHGFDPLSREVIENAEQADSYHGQPSTRDGAPYVYWATDNAARLDAYRLLDGYLSEMARTDRCETSAAADFERNR